MNLLAQADTASATRRAKMVATSLLLALFALQVKAEVVQPFTAKYSAKLDLLIDIPVTAERSLKQQNDGYWVFTSKVSSIVAKQTEQSIFSKIAGQLIPFQYTFSRSVFGRSRDIEIQFDQSKSQITTIAKDKPWSQPWESKVQDKLSYQLQLREDVKAGREELSYRIADGGQIKTYRFIKTGIETLTTPAGEFKCLRLQLDRAGDQPQTLIWMAPELDYLTVRLLRIDNQGREHILNLKEYNFEPKQID